MNDRLKTVAALFNRLLSSYPQFQASDDAMQAYFDAVEPYDPQDVAAGVKQFLTGVVDDFNPAFAPSAPMVGAVVRKQAEARWGKESRERKAALPKPEPEPELTAEELAKRRKFIAEISAKYPQFGIGVEFTAGDDPEARDD